MTHLHQTNQREGAAPWEWQLPKARATRLAPAPIGRWLVVGTGRVWLTESGSGPFGSDVWLAPGERQHLPAGSEWVAEGWPEATVSVLEAPLGASQ